MKKERELLTIANNNAFATPLPSGTGYKHHDNYDGLTKREYFATMALQGVLASGANLHEAQENALFAIKAADALIEALNQQK